MKCQLFASKGTWTTKHNALQAHLGLPTSGTARYAVAEQVTNEAHEDHGKWIMPVVERGRWKCDDQFNANELVDYDPSWFVSPPGELEP